MMMGLQQATAEVLACPVCKGKLVVTDGDANIVCTSCKGTYPIQDGIPMLLNPDLLAQEEERRCRETLAEKFLRRDHFQLLEEVARHHAMPVMLEKSREFQKRFKPPAWILDLGIGWGWHWDRNDLDVNILGVDMAFSNLVLAKRLLGNNQRVVLVCADAALLPVRDRTIAGAWSVQVFQHFPPQVLDRVQTELARVLREDNFTMEIYNLNPPLLHKLIYRLLGRKIHMRGQLGEMMLNRFSAREWTEIWRHFRQGNLEISHSYSELFFHPEFRLRPRRYPMKLERLLARRLPDLAALFARQVQVRLEARQAL
jgi:uncharacterized protein YbaR (Trm112 family)/ubiquinone/menaquinone biosynthesis C-methylase UbiE